MLHHDYHHLQSLCHLPDDPELSSAQSVFLLHLFWNRTFGISGRNSPQAGCPTDSVKHYRKIDHNHRPGLGIYNHSHGKALVPLHRLHSINAPFIHITVLTAPCCAVNLWRPQLQLNITVSETSPVWRMQCHRLELVMWRVLAGTEAAAQSSPACKQLDIQCL